MRTAATKHLVAIVTVTVALIYVLGVYLPQSRRMKSLHNDVQHLQAEIAAEEARLAMAPELHKSVARSRARLASFDSAIPPHDEMGDVLESIDEIARETGLGEMNVVPTDVLEGVHLHCRPIEMNFRGDFPAVYAFLQQVESLPRIVRVQRLELGAVEGRTDLLAASLTVHVYFRRS